MPKKKNETQAQIAARHGVSRRTVSQWAADGVDIHNEKAMAKRAAEKNDREKHGSVDASIRRRRLEAETRREELKLAKEEGALISLAETKDALSRIGAAMKAAISRLEADLPPSLEGLSPAQMQKVIRAKCDEVLGQLEDASSKVWQQ